MVFFQPSGAVRKKGKCCLWTRKNGQESYGFFGTFPTLEHVLPRDQEPQAFSQGGEWQAGLHGFLLVEHVAKPPPGALLVQTLIF